MLKPCANVLRVRTLPVALVRGIRRRVLEREEDFLRQRVTEGSSLFLCLVSGHIRYARSRTRNTGNTSSPFPIRRRRRILTNSVARLTVRPVRTCATAEQPPWIAKSNWRADRPRLLRVCTLATFLSCIPDIKYRRQLPYTCTYARVSRSPFCSILALRSSSSSSTFSSSTLPPCFFLSLSLRFTLPRALSTIAD